jgi:hypothetical protein
MPDQRADKSQPWLCEKCGSKGTVPYRDGDGVYAVLNRIEDAHESSAKWCWEMYGQRFVRVEAKVNV